jgi:hypothetical protein
MSESLNRIMNVLHNLDEMSEPEMPAHIVIVQPQPHIENIPIIEDGPD